jgi:hypothetical protein
MSLLDDLPHRVRHERRVTVREVGKMSHVTTMHVVAASLSSWVQNASSREILEWQKRDQDVTHRVMFHVDPRAEIGDEFVVLSGPGFVGIRVVMLAITDRSAGLGVLYTAMCEVAR